MKSVACSKKCLIETGLFTHLIDSSCKEGCILNNARHSRSIANAQLKSYVLNWMADKRLRSETVITANVIYRVFRLKVGSKTGTAFAIEEGRKEYLVTARHIAQSLQGDCQIDIFKDRGWSPLQVTVVGHAPGDVDISVLAPSERLTPTRRLPLPASSEGLTYGQDAYFLGFPYGISDMFLEETGHPLPLVKRATVSTLFGKPYLLDGHNNPGFSDGPVVFCPPGSNEFQVAAVVRGYRSARANVRDQQNRDTEFHLIENTGIIVAYDVSEAVAMIRADPIGLPLGQD